MNQSPSAVERIRSGLRAPETHALQLERLLRGSDSDVIDVAFGPTLREQVAAFAVSLVRDAVQRLWNQRALATALEPSDDLVRELQAHHRRAVKMAKSSGRIERIKVFQLALIKLLLIEADAEIEAVRDELGDARSRPTSRASGQSLEIHHRAVLLARHVGHVRYSVVSRLIGELLRLERSQQMPLRGAVLGQPWPIAEIVLANPVLQLGGVGIAADFAAHYPLCLLDQERMRRINRGLLETFADWLPEGFAEVEAMPQKAAEARTGGRVYGVIRGLLETERRVRLLCAPAELAGGDDCWLDVPENAAVMLGSDDADRGGLKGLFGQGIEDLRCKLARQLERHWSKDDVRRAIAASYQFNEVYPRLGIWGGEAVVFDFLNGSIGRRDAARRLAGLDDVGDVEPVVRTLVSQRKAVQRRAESDPSRLLTRFTGDFLRLRRDLKLAWRTFAAMDMMRLVERDTGPLPSDDGAPLLAFYGDAGAAHNADDVIGHVIVRVALHGMLDLSVGLQRARIDPASRISAELFDRVTKSVERFGAQKVSIDSDAMVFALVQREGAGHEALAVARACGLARAIADVVAQLNARHLDEDLPPLEIAVAVTYADEPPVFVYDHVRRVLLSAAARRARSLTVNHPVLRRQYSFPGGRGLRVVMPVRQDGLGTDEDEMLARYNVNGIELDSPAFAQLQREIRLQRLEMREKQRGREMIVYAGECTDVRGEVVDIFARERVVRFWMGKQLIDSQDQNRRYYEVVWEPKMVATVRDYLLGEAPDRAVT
jgi:hypothetical protein